MIVSRYRAQCSMKFFENDFCDNCIFIGQIEFLASEEMPLDIGQVRAN
jgi:hypothetical protein